MFSRITSNPAILHGKPCIRGTRYSVEFILELLGNGAMCAEIVRTYPPLAEVDIEEATRYAANASVGAR